MYKEKTHKMFSIPLSEFSGLSLRENYYFDHEENAQEARSLLPFAGSSEMFWLSSKLKPKKVLHKRKGIPRRSPLH